MVAAVPRNGDRSGQEGRPPVRPHLRPAPAAVVRAGRRRARLGSARGRGRRALRRTDLLARDGGVVGPPPSLCAGWGRGGARRAPRHSESPIARACRAEPRRMLCWRLARSRVVPDAAWMGFGWRGKFPGNHCPTRGSVGGRGSGRACGEEEVFIDKHCRARPARASPRRRRATCPGSPGAASIAAGGGGSCSRRNRSRWSGRKTRCRRRCSCVRCCGKGGRAAGRFGVGAGRFGRRRTDVLERH